MFRPQTEEGLKAGRVEGGSYCEVLADRMRLFYLFSMGLHGAGMIPTPTVDRLFHIDRGTYIYDYETSYI